VNLLAVNIFCYSILEAPMSKGLFGLAFGFLAVLSCAIWGGESARSSNDPAAVVGGQSMLVCGICTHLLATQDCGTVPGLTCGEKNSLCKNDTNINEKKACWRSGPRNAGKAACLVPGCVPDYFYECF
jgi:hypothetical protein